MAGFQHKAFFTREKETNRCPRGIIKIRNPPSLNFPEKEENKVFSRVEVNKHTDVLSHKNSISGSSANQTPNNHFKKLHNYRIIEGRRKLFRHPNLNDRLRKISWQGLGNLSYHAIKGEDEFNPASLIKVEDDEEEECTDILKRFGQNRPSDAITLETSTQSREKKVNKK